MSQISFLSSLSALPSADQVREYPGSDVPPEIQALGSPREVHRPGSFAALANFRYPLAALVVAAFGGLAYILYQDLASKNQLDGNALFVFAVIGALAVSFAALILRIPVTNSTVFFYSRAAVVAQKDKLTLIPWKQLLYRRSTISTPEGRQFYCGWLESFDTFEERIWEYSAEHWLPEAEAKIKAGETVKVGELAISAKDISYQGRTTTWDRVTRLLLLVGRVYQLHISTKDTWCQWATIDMHQIPNARAVQQLITNICPPHLLTTAD
ncbi:MAG TPA: DUF6585 family protein [Pirellulaceae bacterium]|nr:DUF6585 family protein [Pirellulaceae bacterium]